MHWERRCSKTWETPVRLPGRFSASHLTLVKSIRISPGQTSPANLTLQHIPEHRKENTLGR